MRSFRFSLCCSGRVVAAMVLMDGPARAQSGLTTTGTINARLIHKSGIALVFNSNAGGVALSGPGTNAASLDFGSISMYGTLTAGVTRDTSVAGQFTVSTPFDVYVDNGGGASASYNLAASLAAAPAPFTFKFDTFTLSTTAVTVVTNDPNYNTNRTHTLYLTVPITAPAGLVSNTVNVTATAN